MIAMTVKKLERERNGDYICPVCGSTLRRVAGGPVRVVDGRVDMENTKSRYECDSCGIFYRELLSSGYFDTFPLEKKNKTKKLRSTGELQPVKLKKDAHGQADCPRCGEKMEFVEGQPVRLVNGKPDMENVLDHFVCKSCHSVYRRIVNTDYFQWTEK